MTAAAARFLPYRWRGGEEWMLVRGPEDGPQVVLLSPLFEEMNFTRALLAEVGRALAGRGVASWLPDLPGTGDSLAPLAGIGWDDWLEAASAIGDAVAARTGGNPLCCAFRGGALLDAAIGARARWRYAAADGASLLRHLRRTQRIAEGDGDSSSKDQAVTALAGYHLSASMQAGLASARPAGDAREVVAEAGHALWHRAEPARDDQLAEQLSADICDWAAACDSR